jgi:hypothetical protein
VVAVMVVTAAEALTVETVRTVEIWVTKVAEGGIVVQRTEF